MSAGESLPMLPRNNIELFSQFKQNYCFIVTHLKINEDSLSPCEEQESKTKKDSQDTGKGCMAPAKAN